MVGGYTSGQDDIDILEGNMPYDDQMEMDDESPPAVNDELISADKQYFVQPFKGAGLRYAERVGTPWEHRRATFKDNPFHPFVDEEAYTFAHWAVTRKQRMVDIDELLQTKYVSCTRSMLRGKLEN